MQRRDRRIVVEELVHLLGHLVVGEDDVGDEGGALDGEHLGELVGRLWE